VTDDPVATAGVCRLAQPTTDQVRESDDSIKVIAKKRFNGGAIVANRTTSPD
jgi:hypothetical protein